MMSKGVNQGSLIIGLKEEEQIFCLIRKAYLKTKQRKHDQSFTFASDMRPSKLIQPCSCNPVALQLPKDLFY